VPYQVSCDQIRELVRLVRPEVVMVEVCKDRLALLVDPEQKAKDMWVCRKVGLLRAGADRCARRMLPLAAPLALAVLLLAAACQAGFRLAGPAAAAGGGGGG
jgi:hypothetical protein